MKKQRQDLGDDVSEDGKPTKPDSAEGSVEGSEGEADKPTSFADKLRAGSNAIDAREGSEEDDRPVATEQEGMFYLESQTFV